MRLNTALLVLLGFLLCACCESAPPTAPGASDGTGLPISTPISPAKSFDVVDTYVHVASGIAFPASSAGFERIASKRYDEEWNNVGIGYRRLWADGRAELTIYVYPAPLDADARPYTLDQGFDGSVQQALAGKPEAAEIVRGTLAATYRGEPVAGRAAEIEYRSGPGFGMQTVVSPIVVHEVAPWHLKYRLTTQRVHRDRTYAAVEVLLADMGLPPLGLPATREE